MAHVVKLNCPRCGTGLASVRLAPPYLITVVYRDCPRCQVNWKAQLKPVKLAGKVMGADTQWIDRTAVVKGGQP